MKIASVLAVAAVGMMAAQVQATFSLVDNFNSYSIGTDGTAGIGSWVQGGGNAATPGFITVQADPASASGNVIKINSNGGNTSLYLNSPSVTVPVGATPATLFYRTRTLNDGLLHELTMGMTDQTAPGTFTAGRAWTMFGNDGDGSPGPTQQGIGVYNATVDNASPGKGFSFGDGFLANDDTWYNIWQVYHNDGSVTGGTYDVYIQGGAFTSQTLLKSGAYFRDTSAFGPTSTLQSLVMLSDDPGVAFVDDIYFDGTHATLTNPAGVAAPEPATLGFVGLALAGLIARRRR